MTMVVDDLPFAVFEAVPTWAALSDVTLLASKRGSRLVRSAYHFALGSIASRVVDGGVSRLTRAGGGTTLTSLREGRLAMAGLDSPDVAAYATTARR